MRKNYLHLYEGEKYINTPTILGLALRAIGAGKSVLYCSFSENQNFIIAAKMSKKMSNFNAILINSLDDINASDVDMLIIDICDKEIIIAHEFIAYNIKKCELILANPFFEQEIKDTAHLITSTKDAKGR